MLVASIWIVNEGIVAVAVMEGNDDESGKDGDDGGNGCDDGDNGGYRDDGGDNDVGSVGYGGDDGSAYLLVCFFL